MMSVNRVHVYSSVCICHAQTTRDIGDTKKYDDNTYTASEDNPLVRCHTDCCVCFAAHMNERK